MATFVAGSMRPATLCLACMVLGACGGKLLASPQTDDAGTGPSLVDAGPSDVVEAGTAFEASVDACTLTDPSSIACGTWDSDIANWEADASSMSTCPWDGGYVFSRPDTLLTFYRKIAVAAGYADPARDVDCTSGIKTCAYDPRDPQLSPQDVHYSNSLGEFIAPDGQPYVWHYEQPLNAWLTADQSTSPRTYAILVARNQVCSSGPGATWSCNCGG